MEKEEITTCSICLATIDICDKSVILVQCCNNKFHISCYLECMKYKKQCPLCRASYNELYPGLDVQSQQLQNQQLQNQQLNDTIVNLHVVEPAYLYHAGYRKLITGISVCITFGAFYLIGSGFFIRH